MAVDSEMAELQLIGTPFIDAETSQSDEVPCLDAIAPNMPDKISTLKSCILDRLRRECSKSIMGAWADPQNIQIQQIRQVW